MVNTEIRLIIFFAAKDGEALYSQQKQNWVLTVAQTMNSSELSFLYSRTLTSINNYWKQTNRALTRWTFVGKVMPLLFNMLSRLVITFLPRSKHLLISWLQMEKLYTVSKNKTGSWLWFTLWIFYCQIQTEIEESGGNHYNIQVWPKSNPLWLYSRSEK